MIKKTFQKMVSLFISVVMMFGVGCSENHTHNFSKEIKAAAYLKSSFACTETYYYSCECGAKGEETFQSDTLIPHKYTAEIASAEYLKTEANCQNSAVYYKACEYCGKVGTSATFTTGGVGGHTYTEEVPEGKYIKAEATQTSSAIYYKTCVCGKVGEDTFSYGDPIRTYTEEEKSKWLPFNLTITLYDSENSLYGFTYHTLAKPLRPVIQVAKGKGFDEDYVEYSCSVKKERGYKKSDTVATGQIVYYYVSKAEVYMEDASSYTYRIYDKYTDAGIDPIEYETKDLKNDCFSFVHMSDSQSSTGSGLQFSCTMDAIAGNCDFILHTGDIVEKARYTSEWKEMINRNFSILSQTPMMTIAGNHEAEYTDADLKVISKHFNNPLPPQNSVDIGEYYSFTYGNAKFIMLNTYSNKLDEAQYSWLVDELKNNTAVWTIVAMHKPCYSPGNWGSVNTSQSESLRAQLGGIFSEYNVDIVLQGHDHVVSRTFPIDANGNITTEDWVTIDSVSYSVDPKGVIYIESGSAGDQARNIESKANGALYHYMKDSKKSSFSKISIKGNKLIVSAQYVNGATVQTYATWGIAKDI